MRHAPRTLTMPNGGHVYILASKPRGVLYIGVTARLLERLAQHRRAEGSKFVSKWRCHTLVYALEYDDIRDAITREEQMKDWHRAWKIELIEKTNPDWQDPTHAIRPD